MAAPARFEIGALRIDVVSDGYFLIDAAAVHGLVPRTLWEAIAGPPDDKNRVPVALNCLVVRDGRRTVLIDTGVGDKIDPALREKGYPGNYGHLLRNLHALGVAPADVDLVINSHLHFDHCGWNTTRVHGAPIVTFPNARYVIQRGEWDAATHPNERTRATYLGDNLVPLDTSDQVDFVDGEHQLTPSIRLLPAPGHTADHMAVVLTSQGETAIYVGDLIHHESQYERPAWIAAVDVLPLVTLETKKRIVEQAYQSGALLLSPHVAYPGAGRIVERDGRRRYVPAEGASS
jgi:glyoxylase-like metal-dependent hydrolase (beta-lactamase superfamily II)